MSMLNHRQYVSWNCKYDTLYVDTNGLQKDDVIKGKFDVISNAGEYFLEYAFTVTAQFLKTNENDIADLFQFANFTRDYPEEAVQFFLVIISISLLKMIQNYLIYMKHWKKRIIPGVR